MDDTPTVNTLVPPAVGRLAAAPPLTAGRYVLGDEIARGGMGVVYQATDTTLGRQVAVKVLQERFATGSDTARRFTAEARITGQLQHPNVPAVHDLGTLPDGRPYLAMKLIHGETLEKMLQARPDPATEHGRFVAVFEQVCQAVAYAHTHRILHRDLKPSNVMVGAFGEVQVMDWGLAKVLPENQEPPPPDSPLAPVAAVGVPSPSERGIAQVDADDAGKPTEVMENPPPSKRRRAQVDGTQEGSVLGTPGFMPPEQTTGVIAAIDARADVFGLGGILAVILTGRPPFVAASSLEALVKTAAGDVAECFARLDGSGADPELIALCKQCLSPRPADRPADAGVVAAAVARLRAAADERARLAERDKLAAEVRRRATLRTAVAVAVVLLLGVAGTTLGLIWADAARQEAETAQTIAQTKEAEANAALQFVEKRVFVAARPAGLDGGVGAHLTLRQAIAACLPHLADDFRGQPRAEARLRLALGSTLAYLDDGPEALRQLEAALALFTVHLGPDHPNTLVCMNNLAMSYAMANRLADTTRLFEQVLDTRRRLLAADDPLVLASRHNLASTFLSARRLTEAIALFERNLPLQRRILGPDHVETLNGLTNLGACFLLSGREAEGTALLVEALAIMRRVMPNHSFTLRTAFILAASYSDHGRHADALPLRREVLAGYRQILPLDHKDTLLAMVSLAGSLHATGRTAEALPLLDEVTAKAKARGMGQALLPNVCHLRLKIARDAKDAAGCRAAAEQYEALGRTGVWDFYNAACYRAVTAGLLIDEPAAKVEADQAMAWLTKAVAAGLKDRAHVENDRDLDALRARADFRKLLESLPAAQTK